MLSVPDNSEITVSLLSRQYERSSRRSVHGIGGGDVVVGGRARRSPEVGLAHQPALDAGAAREHQTDARHPQPADAADSTARIARTD